jgi:hypothetical protein
MRLALIGTFYKRFEQSRACVERVLASSRVPDEIYLICESQEDADNLKDIKNPNIILKVLETPRDTDYLVIPYSNKINWGLDATDADAICYLDNGSMPHIDKYKIMLEALKNNPDWGAVYCTQRRTGHSDMISYANAPLADPYCVVNYTQGMHRKTPVRWTTDMAWARPDLADAIFWRDLQTTFYPVGSEILDEHHMESSQANGL